MHNVLGPDTILGYCTNVHAGATFDEMRANLLAHALPVKRRVSPDAPMGVGLWLSFDAAVQAMQTPGAIGDLRNWMLDQGLTVYTVNGFPFGDFHEPVVKTKVYKPDWTTRDRYSYTLALASILGELLPEGASGSISTLPLGWPPHPTQGMRTDLSTMGLIDPTFATGCAAMLQDLVHYLARIELDTGKCIHIDIEPEPGCVIDTAPGLVRFFEEHLLGTPDDQSVLGYLRVCHDICHSAVMFEPQDQALAAYRSAGIKVGKVQISSAVRVDFDAIAPQQHASAFAQLKSFCEDRYQHQVGIQYADGSTAFFADLPDALAAAQNGTLDAGGQWRVHFHMPIHLSSFDHIGTTQDQIASCLQAIQPDDDVQHFEVETYAWDVLPEALRCEQLADGIAQELLWMQDTFASQAGTAR